MTLESEIIRQEAFSYVVRSLYLLDIKRLILTLQAYVSNCEKGVWKHELKEEKKYNV